MLTHFLGAIVDNHHPIRATMDDFENDDDFEVIETLVSTRQIAGFSVESDEEENERSPRKRNKRRDFSATSERFEGFYSSDQSVYSDADYERRFRMPKVLFTIIEQGITGRGEFVDGNKDATGKEGASAGVNLVAVLRVLAYVMAFDKVDELYELGETTTRKAFLCFLDVFLGKFRETYLRKPNEEYLKRILSIMDSRVFPGCICSWDCQHCSWKNCPVAWAGQHEGK